MAVAAFAQTPQPFPRPNSQKPAQPPPATTPAKLTSYDAGRGQRFYIFGSTIPYAELVSYYKTVLKQKGDELFEAPPTYQFDTAKFRDEAMAFAPSVTIKDYTYGGSAGYPNPKPGATPERFPTIIQIVPVPR